MGLRLDPLVTHRDVEFLKFLGVVLLTSAVAIGLLVAALVWQRDRHRAAYTPGEGVDTLAEFAAASPRPKRVDLVERDGALFIVVVGHCARFPATCSGPPAHVFDAKGRLVAWSTDVGDERFEVHRWYTSGGVGARQITLEDALEMTRSVGGTGP